MSLRVAAAHGLDFEKRVSAAYTACRKTPSSDATDSNSAGAEAEVDDRIWIFLHQIYDRLALLALLAIQPASQNGRHHLESGRVDHDWSLCPKRNRCSDSIGRTVGHYGRP